MWNTDRNSGQTVAEIAEKLKDPPEGIFEDTYEIYADFPEEVITSNSIMKLQIGTTKDFYVNKLVSSSKTPESLDGCTNLYEYVTAYTVGEGARVEIVNTSSLI